MSGTPSITTNRSLIHIRESVEALQKKMPNAATRTLVRFSRGVRALAAYRHLLNNEGIATLRLAEDILNSPRPTIELVGRCSSQLPSAENPRLNLFRNPFDKQTLKDPRFIAFRNAFRWGGGYKIIQIADGCWSNCLMCAAPSSNKDVKFMPFPMVLMLAMQLSGKNSKGKLQFYDGGDVMQWRDTNFDADYGDLAAQLKRMGVSLTGPMTHGFWPGDEYAEEASKKYAALGMDIGLSVHLLHGEVFPTPDSAPSETWLQKYAKRFAHVINILKPDVVRLLGSGPHSPLSRNPYFTMEYTQEYYGTRVLPLIDPSIRDQYAKVDTRKRSLFERQMFGDDGCYKVCLGEFIPEGRAYDSPYFPLVGPSISFGITKTLWHGDMGGDYVMKVGLNGQASVKVSPRFIETPMHPQPVPSKTVAELFPDPLSREFRDFLRKLHFESCRPSSFYDDTVDFWTIFFPERDVRVLEKMFSRIGDPSRLSEEVCRDFHRQLNHLPIASSSLHYKFKIADLREKDGSLKDGGPFSRYLYSLYTPLKTGDAKQLDDKASNILSRANGERQKGFLMSFDEGKKAVERLEASPDLIAAIKSKSCTEAQLREAFAILKGLPLLSPTFFLDVLELQTETVMGFSANTGR